MARTTTGKSGKAPAGGHQQARRRESKETRRAQLIDATIDSLAKRGYAATTMANVSDGARLSRGIVNFHFDSKDNLLFETMQAMADEYEQNWKARFAEAPLDTASRIAALVTADLDARVCTPRKVAAWFALMAEAKARPAYQHLVWEREANYRSRLTEYILKAKDEAGYAYNPENVTAAIYAMQEGMWLRLMLSGRAYGRKTALAVALQMLGTIFPKHFSPEGDPVGGAGRIRSGKKKKEDI